VFWFSKLEYTDSTSNHAQSVGNTSSAGVRDESTGSSSYQCWNL